MLKYDHTKKFASATRLGVAFSALVALGGGAAHAQGAIQLLSPFAPGTGNTTTPYTLGTNGFINSPYTDTVTGSTNTVTFTALATADPNGANPLLQSFTNQNVPGTNTAALDPVAFPLGTNLIRTFDSTQHLPTGPLEIDFGTGVSAFGLYGQSAAVDTYNFTFSVYNGNTLLDTALFTTATTPNIIGSGLASFVGAQATGKNVITKVVLSSFSTAVGVNPNGNSNNFYFGPTTIVGPAPVPEASTLVGFSLGTLLFSGLVLGARKRKKSNATQAAV